MQHNERGAEMMSWLPWYYGDSRIMNEIIYAQSKEIVSIRDKIQYVLAQFYVDTADSFGISIWEKELGITPKAGSDLDLRKALVKAKLMRPPIMTPKQIDAIINLFFEQGTAHAHHVPGTYHLDIEIPWTENLKWPADMREALEEAKPAHLGYTLSYRAYLEETLETIDSGQGDFYSGVYLGFQDGIPYGTNIPILAHDGIHRHGKKVSHGGGFFRGGRIKHGTDTLTHIHRHGKDDLATDRIAYAVAWNFEDSIKQTEEEGKAEAILSVGTENVPVPEEKQTKVEILQFLRHDGSIRHNGEFARGVPLRFSGDCDFVRECRDGKIARGGGKAHRSSPIQWPA